MDKLLLAFSVYLSLPQIPVAQIAHVTYTPSEEIIVNPERGFFFIEATGMEQGRITSYKRLDPERLRVLRQSHSLIFRYFGLKEWRTSDLPENVLQDINADFSAIRDAGMKCIPRFTYSADIGEPDAALSVILRHLEQLKPILRANKDVIALMQAGFIGAWGEWHSSTNGNETPEAMRTVLNKILDVLPERMVQVRTPRYKQEIFSLQFDTTAAVTRAQAFTGIAVARTGHHNDCFLADADDRGTYWRNNHNDTAMAKAYLRLDNRFVPMGGETCAPGAFALCPNAVSEMARLRWSFMNGGYNEQVLSGFVSGGCMDEMKRKLGYRIALLSTEFSSSIKRMGTFALRARLVNTGWASPFNRRDVEVLLRDNRNGRLYVAKLPVDPRFWLSGDTITVDANVGVPAFIRDGAYSVLLRLPDPEPSLAARPEYAIRLANVGTWEPSTGCNSLLDSVRVDGNATDSRYDGALWFRSIGENSEGDVPILYSMGQNYPNPFNSSTTIPLVISSSSLVQVTVSDIVGQQTKVLVNEQLPSSPIPYAIRFDGLNLASGVYVARVRATPIDGRKSGFVAARKLLLLK